ncbi:restriction endonuclease [Halobacillus locisalis]|uniref:Restriction endonuclease n=2 Tax=Halobacillus locisalis TaxID=220753 RepID=A0A838CVQ8_9BACI|nr:restriction endonuclease [Halobacillus locisalis]
MEINYDEKDPISIKEYGEKLIGSTFADVIREAETSYELKQETIGKVNRPGYKGGVGHLIEKFHFGYELNSNQEADFPEAGVELKVTPYEIGKKGGYSAGERLVISMISYEKAVEENLYSSHLYNKLNLSLLIHYLRDRSIPRTAYPIDYVTLFSPPEEDMKIIEQDYEKIISKVKDGKAHELSEGDTMYLGACTKGSNAEKSTVPQKYYAVESKARKRAFCFKQSYMTYVLNKYVLKKVDTYESILKDTQDLKEQSFENLIIDKINAHRGKTDEQLKKELGLNSRSKSFWSALAYRMLGVRSNSAKEFVKANIEVKAIRIEENGSMKESISFPSISFKEFEYQEWEESDFYNDLSSKRYLFVVFKKNGDKYVLKGAQLWNINNEDLEAARDGWLKIQDIVRRGVHLEKKPSKNGKTFTVENNFPEKSDNPVIHIRPHASKRYYELGDGEIIGNDRKCGDELPDGRMMTKQSFWLNNNYILEQLDAELKE